MNDCKFQEELRNREKYIYIETGQDTCRCIQLCDNTGTLKQNNNWKKKINKKI